MSAAKVYTISLKTNSLHKFVLLRKIGMWTRMMSEMEWVGLGKEEFENASI